MSRRKFPADTNERLAPTDVGGYFFGQTAKEINGDAGPFFQIFGDSVTRALTMSRSFPTSSTCCRNAGQSGSSRSKPG